MSEKLPKKDLQKVNSRVAVNLGKCASCPLAERCAVVQLKRPEVTAQADCQTTVESMDAAGGEYLPSTKQQFEDPTREIVWANDLRVKQQKEIEEQQRRKDKAKAELHRKAEQQRLQRARQQAELQEKKRAEDQLRRAKNSTPKKSKPANQEPSLAEAVAEFIGGLIVPIGKSAVGDTLKSK